MSTQILELFNGGLVTARHPALLQAGELQRTDDCVYREKDPAVWRAPGRTQYGTAVSGSPVLGLAYLPFERKFTPKVVAYASSTLWSMPVEDANNVAPQTSTEIGGPAAVVVTASIVSTHTVLTADSGTPFLPQIVGARIYTATLNNTNIGAVMVSAVTGTPVNGYYPAVIVKQRDGTSVSATFGTSASITVAFSYGVAQTLVQDGVTARNNILDVHQFGAAYFAQFGYSQPRKIEWLTPTEFASNPVLSHRPIGLEAVTTPIEVHAISGVIGTSTDVYAWRTSLGTGYFWFLATEIYIPQVMGKDGNLRDDPGSEIESAYLAISPGTNLVGEPVAVSIPNLLTGVRVVLPAVKNVGLDGRIATHWGIYMSPEKTDDASGRPSLATFRRVAKMAIKTLAAGSNTHNDPGSIEIYETTGTTQALYASSVAALNGSNPDWTSSSSMLGAPNGNVFTGAGFAKGVSNSSVSSFGAVHPVSKLSFSIDATGPNANRNVTGIAIQVFGRANSTGDNQQHADVFVYPTNGTGKDGIVRSLLFHNGGIEAYVLGGSGETWGVTWGAFSTLGSFGIVIGVGANDADMTAWIDAVRLVIFGESMTIDLNGKPYRCVVYRDQIGISQAEPACLVPPSCSTATFNMGMYVTNDLSDDTAIRYSLPGFPEYFPRPYVLRLNSGQRRDKVTLLTTLGQILVCGLENSIERINFLPRETNTDLEDGLAHEPLTVDHGIPGPLAAVKFDMPGQGSMLAYASNSGVYLTNGIWIRPLNIDLDWQNTVNVAFLSSCVFRVYAREKWLILYYCPAGASHGRNTRALVFSYAVDKVKEGMLLPCTGPISVSARASCEAIINGSPRILTGHETTGLIYTEDSGTAQASGYTVHNSSNALVAAPILPLIRTRRFYPAGLDRDGFEDKIHLLFSSYGSNSVTASSTTTINSTTVTSSAAFGSVLPGMRVLGNGIDGGTIVLSKTNSSTIVLSRAANASGTATLTFDTGTLGVTIRGNGIGAVVGGMKTAYISTLVGDLVSLYNANIQRGFEIQIEKVPLTFDSNHDTATSADLDTNMRLHQLSFVVTDGGPDTNRSTA